MTKPKRLNPDLDKILEIYLSTPPGESADQAWANYTAAINAAKEVRMKFKPECKCLRCGHEWDKRGEGPPIQCPRCKQTKWDTPARAHKLSGTGDDVQRSIEGTPHYQRLVEKGYCVGKAEEDGMVLMVR